MTFRYNVKSGHYQRAQANGAKSLESILREWQNTTPTKEKYEAYSGRRRSNVIWTHEAANLVLDLVDTTKCSKRYTNTQIAEQLNRPETEAVYKHPKDRGRVFTAGWLGLRRLSGSSGPTCVSCVRDRVRVEGSLGPTCVPGQETFKHF